ncbi:unnamed protein product [Lymnaea stagnalis]|uniref:Palmitoyltransferase n=1 Tax=Lymnaea stagnalis TaxID=6523 RepID=A0AAV2HGY8_LYMST
MMAPPRSKHCPLCKACILKRDHHCFFAGCCVGFHNQRYFTIFCLYAGVASFYVWTFMSYYLSEHYEPLQTWGYLSYLPPLVLYFWMFGIISLSSLGLVTFQYFICVAGLSCFYFVIIQMYLIVCGQTRYECVKGIHVYKGTVRENILSVFGPLWVIGFFFPVPFLGYYGDGKNWHEWQSKV